MLLMKIIMIKYVNINYMQANIRIICLKSSETSCYVWFCDTISNDVCIRTGSFRPPDILAVHIGW